MNKGGNLDFTSSNFLHILIYVGTIGFVAACIIIATHVSDNTPSEKQIADAETCATGYTDNIPKKAAVIPNLKSIGNDSMTGPMNVPNSGYEVIYSSPEYLQYIKKNCLDKVSWQIPVENSDTLRSVAGTSIITDYESKKSKSCPSGYACQGPWSLNLCGLVRTDREY